MENHNYPLPSASELVLWNSGNFPEGPRKQEIKKIIENDAFIQAAVSGLTIDPSMEYLPPFITPPTSQGGSFKNHFLGWGLGLSTGLILGLLVYWWYIPATNQPVPTQPSTLNETAPLTTQPGSSERKKTLPLSNHSTAQNREVLLPATEQQNQESPEHISSLPEKKLNTQQNQSWTPPVLTIEIEGQKVYPYYERTTSKSGFDLDELHTQAAFENHEQQNQQKNRNSTVGYLNFLEETIRLFNQGRWSESAAACDMILKSFPNDLNALYYMGRCLFQQGDQEKARAYFNKVQAHELPFFQKESAEYLRIIR
jgi:TolA-binding protein